MGKKGVFRGHSVRHRKNVGDLLKSDGTSRAVEALSRPRRSKSMPSRRGCFSMPFFVKMASLPMQSPC